MGTKSTKLTQAQVANKYGWRSGLEERIAVQIERAGHAVRYEQDSIKYVQPAKLRTYTPDFILDNGIIIETKGRFVMADRQKHIMIRKQFPDLDIRFVFTNPNAKINKGSKTTYASWCDKNGFMYSKDSIPEAWFYD